MAPTEFLAAQHYERIKGWLKVLAEEERPEVALLTGSTPASKARIIRSVRLTWQSSPVFQSVQPLHLKFSLLLPAPFRPRGILQISNSEHIANRPN
jgi:hypothetical protein